MIEQIKTITKRLILYKAVVIPLIISILCIVCGKIFDEKWLVISGFAIIPTSFYGIFKD